MSVKHEIHETASFSEHSSSRFPVPNFESDSGGATNGDCRLWGELPLSPGDRARSGAALQHTKILKVLIGFSRLD